MAVSTVERPLSFDKLRMVSLVEPFAKSRETQDSLCKAYPNASRQHRQLEILVDFWQGVMLVWAK
jgi:hypothetical protein